MSLLRDSCLYAQTFGRSIWDFAVEIECLRALGGTNSDLRFLIRKGYVEHGTEVTQLSSRNRVFRKPGSLKFTDNSCFVLTGLGQSIARKASVTAAKFTAAG